MSNFFTKIFKPSRKSNRGNFQPLEDYGGQRSSTIKQNSRHEFDTAHLKSSMRRRATAYDDEFLHAPTAAYHTAPQPQRHRGPKSLPPSRTFEDSANASPSSSTDGGGYGLERSFHSEFIPSSQQQPSTSRRKHKKQQHRIPATDFYPLRDERHTRYLKEESDSMMEEEMNTAMKQIKRYKNSLKIAIEDVRKARTENDRLMKQMHLLKIEKDHTIQQLESEIAQLSQEKRSLELENQSLKSMGYSSYGGAMPQHRYHHYQPSYLPPPPPPSHYQYMTPPSGIRSAAQFNNTNTGSLMASGGGGERNNNTFRGAGGPSAPHHHHQHHNPHGGEHLFGNNNNIINNGSGEQLAFDSANTTASQAMLPGMPLIPASDEISDEVKIFRKVDESSPSRPPTNSNQSLILSTGIGGGSNSTGSSPPTNTNNSKTNEQTPVASIKKESPKVSNPNIDAFNEIISKQLIALTPKSSKVKKTKSLSTMDEIVVNFETATNLNH